VATGAINSLWDILKDEVEVNFVFLYYGLDRVEAEKISNKAHLLSIRVEECTKIDYVGVRDEPHNLKLTILGGCIVVIDDTEHDKQELTLNRLSWSTFLMAMSS